MFYTPGWGNIFTLTGTLGGVLVTQFVNSALSRGVRRRERNEGIKAAVSELIASASAWVSMQEQDLLESVSTNDKEMEGFASTRTAVYAAQRDYGRALARVRVVCPPEILSAAEEYRYALMDREQQSAIVDDALNQLVTATRKATGESTRKIVRLRAT